MKHAFLISAYHQFEILGKMISLLDDKNCDFFVHIDKKTKENPSEYLTSMAKKSRVIFIDRIHVNWGGYSQVDCTLRLLKEATHSHYDYYHYLSGADFPVKAKEKVLKYFDENNGTQFVHFERPIVQEKYVDRLKYHSFFQDSGNSLLQTVDKGIRQLERTIKLDRVKSRNISFQYGSQWFSITHDFAEWIVKHEPEIEELFQYTRCGDELFIQTMLINSPYANQVPEYAYDNDYRSCLRFIDWKRGKPYVFRLEDLSELLDSPFLFARKFDLNIDSAIVDALFDELN